LGQKTHDLVDGFLGKSSVTEPVGFVDEKDSTESLLEYFLSLWPGVTDV
jgi:hypothetical protein